MPPDLLFACPLNKCPKSQLCDSKPLRKDLDKIIENRYNETKCDGFDRQILKSCSRNLGRIVLWCSALLPHLTNRCCLFGAWFWTKSLCSQKAESLFFENSSRKQICFQRFLLCNNLLEYKYKRERERSKSPTNSKNHQWPSPTRVGTDAPRGEKKEKMQEGKHPKKIFKKGNPESYRLRIYIILY